MLGCSGLLWQRTLVKTHRRAGPGVLVSLLGPSAVLQHFEGLGWLGLDMVGQKLERYILDEPFFGVSQVLSDLITSWVGCKSTRRAVISCFTWSDLVWTLPIFFTWKRMRFGRATSQVVFHVFLDPGSVALESLLVRRWTCQQT